MQLLLLAAISHDLTGLLCTETGRAALIMIGPTEHCVLRFFAIGGSLEFILQQDGCLPEDCVRSFGLDLVRGLHYIHSMGLVFCDIIPSKVGGLLR